MSTGRALYQLGFEISPIVLTGGIASQIPGGMLPIIAITEAANFIDGLLSGADISPDNFFAHYRPAPGTTLARNMIATYPFANQTVAANALIAEPLKTSMLMMCPARNAAGAWVKLATMAALQKTLALHNSQGGLYSVVTPSYIYTGCMMTAFVDVSEGSTRQSQATWQMDFVQPLTTLTQAQSVVSGLMQRLGSGARISGQPSWSGVATTIAEPFSLAGTSVITAAKDLIGMIGG